MEGNYSCDFHEFLHSECSTIDTSNPFIWKHENEICTVTEEGTNVWDDNVRDELKVLVHEGLLAMKMIEDVKRELRKALGLDLSDKTFDKMK